MEVKDGLGHARWVTGDLLDRSEQGIGVALMTPLKPGSTILVIGRFAEDRTQTQRQATVNWCREGSNGTYNAGLEFVDPKPGPRSEHQIVPSDSLELAARRMSLKSLDLDYYGSWLASTLSKTGT
jgi:hypothetical protein